MASCPCRWSGSKSVTLLDAKSSTAFTKWTCRYESYRTTCHMWHVWCSKSVELYTLHRKNTRDRLRSTRRRWTWSWARWSCLKWPLLQSKESPNCLLNRESTTTTRTSTWELYWKTFSSFQVSSWQSIDGNDQGSTFSAGEGPWQRRHSSKIICFEYFLFSMHSTFDRFL